MGKEIVASYDNKKYYVKDAMLLLKKSESVDLRYITAILNSRLISYFYKNYNKTIDVSRNVLLELSIAQADDQTVSEVSGLSEQMEDYNNQLKK